MNIFIDTQDMEERYGEELYKEYLENENKEMKEKIKKIREYCKREIGNIIANFDYIDLKQENEDYKSRIEKAIDYIKEHKKEITKTEANIFNEDRQDKSKLKVGTFMWNVDELEDILRGGKE